MSVAHPRTRVLLAKAGLDGHNRGLHVVSRALVDAGFEVVYLGVRRTPAEIAAAAAQEDVAAVGLSLLSGAHLELTERIRTELRAAGAGDLPILIGGIIPQADRGALRALGVVAIHGPGTPLEEVVLSFRKATARRPEPEPAR